VCSLTCLASLVCLCLCKFFSFYVAVIEVSVLRSNFISLDNWLPNFADGIAVLSLWVDVLLYSFWTLRPLNFGTSTSGTNYQVMGLHIPEEWRSHVCSCLFTNSVL